MRLVPVLTGVAVLVGLVSAMQTGALRAAAAPQATGWYMASSEVGPDNYPRHEWCTMTGRTGICVTQVPGRGDRVVDLKLAAPSLDQPTRDTRTHHGVAHLVLDGVAVEVATGDWVEHGARVLHDRRELMRRIDAARVVTLEGVPLSTAGARS